MKIRIGILTAPQIDFVQNDKTFLLKNVRIGIGFHWDRNEDQEFAGQLEILHNPDGTQTAVNIIDIEDYLCSVISSEMSADSPLELLKAHAVISRSWVLRLLQREKQRKNIRQAAFEDGGHVGFDVCADDHCQRYEGLRRMNARAVQAVRETAGQVLTFSSDTTHSSELCDCRFYKCCGGKTELFSTCWEDIDYPYLQSVECHYCNTQDASILRTVLNQYDQETADFHDWKVTYTNRELHDILLQKTGIDFGDIIDLFPLKRGASGRIYSLQIKGSLCTHTIGKELAIRRALSPTCLYSSWFTIHHTPYTTHHTPSSFTLIGHGWGHGVGLCQIGAAVMATQQHSYQDILSFYYPNTHLQQY